MLSLPKQFLITNMSNPKIPSFCPVCKDSMFGSSDVEAFERNKCCRECEFDFAEPNSESWKSGWRPKPEEVKAKKEVRFFFR